MLESVKRITKKHGFIIAIIIFAILKQILITSIPITPYPNQGYDDDMMVEMAKNIRAGNWLGDYTSNILVKGPVFPIILAVINYFGLSYIGTMNIIYTIACIFFVYVIKDIFKSKKSLFAIYLVLLFNPVSYAFWTLQRVYRNGITLAQVLFIIGSLFAMYQRKEKSAKKILPFGIIGGLSLATLWLTREDGIWILPFVLVVTAIIIVSTIVQYLKNSQKEKQKINWKEFIGKLVVSILPIIILFTSLHITRAINYRKYGVYEYNEINDGYFGKVIKIIYSVNTDEDIQYVTATRKKINILYEYSETLNSIKPELEASMDAWDYNDRHPGDTQVEDGWFWWALKQAAENANIYENAKTSDEFYKKVYNEIEQAINEGKIETQISMPSKLMSPWKKRYFIELPKSMARTTWYVINFEDVKTVNFSKDIPDDKQGVSKFEAITNNLAATNKEDNSTDNATKYTKKYVERLNNIGKLYKYTGLLLAIIAFFAYIILTIKMIKNREKKNVLDIWLLLTGVACSLIVLIGGVSYNHITSCFSRYYMYLSGSYPLVSIFCMGNICYLIENIKTNIDENGENNGKDKK